MSLPTPPRSSYSSHKQNKENTPTKRVVAWAQHNQIHTLSFSSPSKTLRTPTSASRDLPARSILKKQSSMNFASLPQDICDEFKPREVTPEPEDPLCDLKYLEHPVSRIVSSSVSLKDLTEAYSVLAARLRTSIAGSKGETDADASWPLFQPIRKNRDVFVNALLRDLGRALVDPLADESCTLEKEKRILAPLPSPNSTPRKKKDGMTAEQVKYARDLCTVSHSVIRLLNVIWTIPAVCGIFTNEENGKILSQVLAIPLAPELPTINARKTCALAVWLIQTQRLPKDVLAPLADMVASALKRAIDGELGKEGKKGSVSDGLRAVNDLCVYLPTVFVKSFAPVLPTILQNLLAPTLALRVQACQALGGIVSGANKAISRKGHIHARFARLVRFFLTRSPNKNREGKATGSTPSTPKEPAVIRTLRVTLEATDPQHSAQGPVWALNVLANFIALLGPLLIEDHALRRSLSSLLTLGLRHPKSSVRALACIVWRPLIWAFFQPAFQFDVVGEDVLDSLEKIEGYELLTEEEKEERKWVTKQQREAERLTEIEEGRKSSWKLLTTVVECQTGLMMIAALLASCRPHDDTEDENENEDTDEAIKRILSLLNLMILKGGQNCGDAIEIARRLVRFDQAPPSNSDSDVQITWHVNMLLPRSLFSATSNLLTVEFKSLSTSVRAILERSAGLDVIRSLTRDELARDWVFDGLIEVWREAVGCLEMYDGDETPTDISEVWDGLIKANVYHLQDSDDDNATIAFTLRAADILIDVIQDQNIDLTPKATIPPSSTPAPKPEIEVISVTLSSDPPQEDTEPTKRFSNGALKLRVVRDLWATVRTTVPNGLTSPASEKLLACLVKNEGELLGGGDVLDYASETDEAALKLWTQLSAELLASCDINIVRSFWGCDPVGDFAWNRGPSKMAVWGMFVQVWQAEVSRTWDTSLVLLSVPFMDTCLENCSVDVRSIWESLLDNTIVRGLDHGLDSSTVLEEVASSLLHWFDWESAPCPASFICATDNLLSRLDLDPTARDIPLSLFRLVNDVLGTTYPPSGQVKQYARWVLRTLSDIVRRCDVSENENLQEEVQVGIITELVPAVKESVVLWITDEKKALDDEEWAYDVEPLYGYLLSALSLFPKKLDTLNEHMTILESALLGNEFRTPLTAEAFRDFWARYSDVKEPREGWHEGLVRCLVASGLRDSNPMGEHGQAIQASSPPPSAPLVLGCIDSRERDDGSVTRTPPSTPSRRTEGSSGGIRTFSHSSLRPCSPSSPTWIATRNKSLDSRKRRRIAGDAKENEPYSTEVVGNILSKRDCGSPPTTPSKRKLESVPEPRESYFPSSPSKRHRSDHVANLEYYNNIEEEDSVVSTLLASPQPKVVAKKSKRTRIIMEAVEIPTFKMNAAKMRSFNGMQKKNVLRSSTLTQASSMPNMRRVNEAVKDRNERSQLPKRKRRYSHESDYEDEDPFGLSPLPSLLTTCKRSVTMPPALRSAAATCPPSITPTPIRMLTPKSNEKISIFALPSSPSPQRHLALVDSDNEDDHSKQHSSPLQAKARRNLCRV